MKIAYNEAAAAFQRKERKACKEEGGEKYQEKLEREREREKKKWVRTKQLKRVTLEEKVTKERQDNSE